MKIFLVLSLPGLVFAEEQIDIRDIKPPLSYGFNYWAVLLFLIILIVITALGWYLVTRLKKSKQQPIVIRPPHEVALKRLSELKRKDFIKKGLIKEFYIELSDIVRRYIEARFSFRAPEMTTEEFLSSLKYSSILSQNEKELLGEFLVRCDLVKFAKYSPSLSEIELSLNSAEDFIIKTKKEDLIKEKEDKNDS